MMHSEPASGHAEYYVLAGSMAIPKSVIDTLCSPAGRHEMIARAAYYRAERRGFEPGHALEDWLAAEHDVDAVCGLIEPHASWDSAGPS